MRKMFLYLLLIVSFGSLACSKKVYSSNGSTIYNTGRNINGDRLLDKSASGITIIKSCRTCHGKNGDAMRSVSVRFKDLSNSTRLNVPYTDSLFYRFLDHDLKSDGSRANIGVIWKIGDSDKKDLLAYLKSL